MNQDSKRPAGETNTDEYSGILKEVKGMSSQRPISPRRKRRSGGNAFVELSLTLLPTFAIITGFFDVSFALFSWSTLQNAVREGCRFAITFQTTMPDGSACPSSGHLDSCIAQVTANNSMGLVSGTSPLIYVKYFAPTSPNTVIASPNGDVPGNLVEVSVEGYLLQWMIPISGTFANPFRSTSPASTSVYARDVMGGYPAGVTSVTR